MPQSLNPYAAQLGDRNVREVLSATPELLNSVVQRLSPNHLENTYAPGKWTARILLCHLADCELAFGFRMRQALAETNHLIQPFDQDAWAPPYQNQSLTAQTSIRTFTAVRSWNLSLFDSLTPELLSKPARHPERGEITVRTIFETMAGHDLHHLSQFALIASHPV